MSIICKSDFCHFTIDHSNTDIQKKLCHKNIPDFEKYYRLLKENTSGLTDKEMRHPIKICLNTVLKQFIKQ